MPGPTDEAWLRAHTRAEKGRAKWRAFKGTPERQCTAKCRNGRRCLAPRLKRPDGTLAPTCRMHGSAPPKTLEAQALVLERLVKYRQAQADGARTSLARVREAMAKARSIEAADGTSQKEVSFPAENKGNCEVPSQRPEETSPNPPAIDERHCVLGTEQAVDGGRYWPVVRGMPTSPPPPNGPDPQNQDGPPTNSGT